MNRNNEKIGLLASFQSVTIAVVFCTDCKKRDPIASAERPRTLRPLVIYLFPIYYRDRAKRRHKARARARACDTTVRASGKASRYVHSYGASARF